VILKNYNMLKKDLINQVSAELTLQKQDVNIALNILLTKMSGALTEGRRVEIRGFGSFSTRKRRSRRTKNPKTGTTMDIPERQTLHFTMSKSLKEALISETD
jgi:integration host factor subunit beta